MPPSTGRCDAWPATVWCTTAERPGPWLPARWRASVTALWTLLPARTHGPHRAGTKSARRHGTTGVAGRRRAQHAAERAAYREALDRLAEHRSQAVVLVRDGDQVLIPAPRADEIPAAWHSPDGSVLDPATGRPAADWRLATDGRLILITPTDQLSYDELAAAHAQALSEWESAA
ncbi:hypothetical protein [Streptomyces olivochromogenes]|uniref:hypothetical protein n=1 Tax=Streptomyces olivochromogenes TaxID=1963 RepID=UPI001F30311A|nr:hypothetical protein [Streptomyces olivochromogenes]